MGEDEDEEGVNQDEEGGQVERRRKIEPEEGRPEEDGRKVRGWEKGEKMGYTIVRKTIMREMMKSVTRRGTPF